MTLSVGQSIAIIAVCAAAADLSHGRTCCSYISEQERQRSEEQRRCSFRGNLHSTAFAWFVLT